MGVDGALNGGGKYLLEVVWTGIEIINVKYKTKKRIKTLLWAEANSS